MTKGALNYHRTTPRAGVTYLVTDSVSAYYNYSEGFRVPTTLEMFTLTGQPNLELRPIRSRNHEIGFKGRFGSAAEGSIAFYQSSSNDIFFTCNVCDPGTPAFDGQNRNADEVRRRGIETTLKARWNEYLDGIINYSYTQAEFQSAFNLSQTKMVQAGDETLEILEQQDERLRRSVAFRVLQRMVGSDVVLLALKKALTCPLQDHIHFLKKSP